MTIMVYNQEGCNNDFINLKLTNTWFFPSGNSLHGYQTTQKGDLFKSKINFTIKKYYITQGRTCIHVLLKPIQTKLLPGKNLVLDPLAVPDLNNRLYSLNEIKKYFEEIN